jgi:plastocyanin
MKIPVKFALPLAALASVAALTAGCGGSSSSASSTPSAAPTTSVSTGTAPSAGTVTVSASATAIAYDQKELSASAGHITFKFTNPGSFPHNFSIKGTDGTKIGGSDTVTGKDAPPFTLPLAAGTYTFYCSVDGHEAAGMTGTLTVK